MVEKDTLMSKSFYLVSFSVLLALFCIYSNPLFFLPSFSIESNSNNLTIFSISTEGDPLSESKFLIEPNPFDPHKNFLKIFDNSFLDKDKKEGIIFLTGLPYGIFTITQYGIQSDYEINNLSKRFVFDTSSKNYTFTFTNKKTDSLISNFDKDKKESYTYNAKFVCGSISGSEGPLRPGHYDTDISIYNKQKYSVEIFWNVVENEGSTSNAIIKKINPESSTVIVCKDILNLLGKNQKDREFKEGFVIIEENSLGGFNTAYGSKSEQVFGKSQTGLLDIQVFYTANALEQLPHEIIIGSVIFQITNSTSSKIPKDQLNTDLLFTTGIESNKIINLDEIIKTTLALHYNLTSTERELLNLKIIDTDLGASSMIDDHAISLTHVLPQYLK